MGEMEKSRLCSRDSIRYSLLTRFSGYKHINIWSNHTLKDLEHTILHNFLSKWNNSLRRKCICTFHLHNVSRLVGASTGLLPETWNCGLRMHRECRERFIPTCVTHVPWCMLGSLTSGLLLIWWRRKRSRHFRRMRNPKFYVSGKRLLVSTKASPHHDHQNHHTGLMRLTYIPYYI